MSDTVMLLLSLCFLFAFSTEVSLAADHRRRLLHQPFFPAEYIPPTEAPFLSPQPQPQQPKLPFSFSSSTPQKPFFPSYRSSPPPPSPVAFATFPANISSLLFPQPTSQPHRHFPAVALSVSLLSAALLVSLGAFLYYRRTRKFVVISKASRSDSLRLYPPDIATSDGVHKPGTTSNTSREFLYIGTLVNSRGIDEEAAENSGNVGSELEKLGSPELKPLPPLSRQNFSQEFINAKGGSSKNEENEDDEEFFSPRGSSSRRESLCNTASSSKYLYRSAEAENYGHDAFNSRSPTYCSNSASPASSASNSPSQPQNLSPASLMSKSPDSAIIFPVPMRPLPSRPLVTTTSPLSSSSSSPSQQGSGVTHYSPLRNSEIPVHNSKFSLPTQSPPAKLAPPPPPPPPPRFWEIPVPPKLAVETNAGPPVLVGPSIPVVLQNLGPVSAAEQSQGEGNGDKERNEETPKLKLKPLHWDKVRASSDRAMVWDQIKSSSFQLNEEMIETLFVVNNSSLGSKENGARRQVLPSPNQENRVLDPKKSQNIAILLRALNVTVDEVCEALWEGNSDTLGTELPESLLKMAPTEEEERNLRDFKDESPFKLGPAEKFLKAVLYVPFAFKRVDAMLYIANFDSEIEYLKRSFETLEAACKQLRNSRMFLKLLEAVLKTGNRMNVGTNRGDAQAFKLDTLLKLVDVKGTDRKTTLLHFVVQEIIRAEGSRLSGSTQSLTSEKCLQSLTDDVEFRKLGLQVVSGLSGELSSVKKAAAMDAEVLSREVAKLAGGVTKVAEVMKLNEEIARNESTRKFSESMNQFLRRAEGEIVGIQTRESVALSMVKEITEYFHGNSAMEEAHPFRIFMVVRDFLSILDQVCKDVGKINERTIVGSARQILTPVNPILPPMFPGFTEKPGNMSSDEDSSS